MTFNGQLDYWNAFTRNILRMEAIEMTFQFEGVMTMIMEQSMIISGIIHSVTKIAMKQVLHTQNAPSRSNQEKLNTKSRATV